MRRHFASGLTLEAAAAPLFAKLLHMVAGDAFELASSAAGVPTASLPRAGPYFGPYFSVAP